MLLSRHNLRDGSGCNAFIVLGSKLLGPAVMLPFDLVGFMDELLCLNKVEGLAVLRVLLTLSEYPDVSKLVGNRGLDHFQCHIGFV